jgi:membrane-anchored protein YejM (alkaline phosphatase superfamily)
LEINARQHGRFDLLNFLFDVKQAYADWLVGQVYQTLRETNVLNRTFLIVTSDHGQMLGEQGLFGHGEPLYEPVIRVPMFMRDPSRFSKGTTFAGLVSLVDLFPTILERAGVKTGDSKDMHGKSLFRMVKDGKGRSFVLAEAYGEKNVRSYISSNLKLMVEEGKGLILYDLVQDSREQKIFQVSARRMFSPYASNLKTCWAAPGNRKSSLKKTGPMSLLTGKPRRGFAPSDISIEASPDASVAGNL